jgi:serine/threonine protein kinase
VARLIPEADRRIAEEAVRVGLAAAIVMEQGAREWSEAEDDETFPAYLIRREVLNTEQIEELVEALETPEPDEAVEDGDAPKAARPPSEVIPGYRILERLGRGGMGSVYRAEQIGMKRTVALKILRRPLARDAQQVERLRREARLVGSLNHTNIVRGLDVGQHGPYHYFAMEYVEGHTLRDRLKNRGAMPEAEVLRILVQVAEALDHAHSRGVIHRDVKPGNMMLTPDGLPKLTDYGLAKGPADFTLTQSGVTIGTPQYISPEQARDPAGVDIQTDLYSLGATAYHMLTGVPPHTSETLAGLLTKVLYEKPRTARQVNARVSPGRRSLSRSSWRSRSAIAIALRAKSSAICGPWSRGGASFRATGPATSRSTKCGAAIAGGRPWPRPPSSSPPAACSGISVSTSRNSSN